MNHAEMSQEELTEHVRELTDPARPKPYRPGDLLAVPIEFESTKKGAALAARRFLVFWN